MTKTTIAFTSCVRYKDGEPQPIWNKIRESNPDYLFLLGDQIYMDFGIWPFSPVPNGRPRAYTPDQFEWTMRGKYARQWEEPNFKALFTQMSERGALFGVYDDHDFAWNNAYGNDLTIPEEYNITQKKEISRKLFHEFMNCSTNLPEVYCYKDTEHARLIFLDNRYYASGPSEDHPVLMGHRQMDWLRQTMIHDKQYTIISGGLSLSLSPSNWSNYTAEFSEFRHLVMEAQSKVIYLGGDVHYNKFIPPRIWYETPPCYEIISSGVHVNRFGLPFEFDMLHNWSTLDIDETGVVVTQHSKNKINIYRINACTWLHKQLL